LALPFLETTATSKYISFIRSIFFPSRKEMEPESCLRNCVLYFEHIKFQEATMQLLKF